MPKILIVVRGAISMQGLCAWVRVTLRTIIVTVLTVTSVYTCNTDGRLRQVADELIGAGERSITTNGSVKKAIGTAVP